MPKAPIYYEVSCPLRKHGHPPIPPKRGHSNYTMVVGSEWGTTKKRRMSGCPECRREKEA